MMKFLQTVAGSVILAIAFGTSAQAQLRLTEPEKVIKTPPKKGEKSPPKKRDQIKKPFPNRSFKKPGQLDKSLVKNPLIQVNPQLAFEKTQTPSQVGERSLLLDLDTSSLIYIAPELLFDQRPASDTSRAGRHKLELEIRHGGETFGQSKHRVIPEVVVNNGEYKFTAVLPQYNTGATPDEYSDAYYQNRRRYVVNPTKFKAAEKVYYRWILKNSSNAAVYTSSEGSFAMPRPYTIVAIGDSFGAGEGAPEIRKASRYEPSRNDMIPLVLSGLDEDDDEQDYGQFAKWENRKPHRSKYSGFSQGVKKFRVERSDVWVEFRNFSISSATLTAANGDKKGGVISYFSGDREIPAWLSAFVADGRGGIYDFEISLSQIHQAEDWLREDKIDHADVLLVSIGGNDGGFGKIITKSLRPIHLVFSEEDVAKEIVADGLRIAGLNMRNFYDSVEHNIRPTDVYWSEYPNVALVPRESPTGLIWHDDTLDLGIDLALITASASATGLLIGAMTFPFTPLTGSLASGGTFDALSNEFNASPMALGMSMAVSGPELAVADRFLRDYINIAVVDFCENFPALDAEDERLAQRNDDESRCEVIEIQDNVRVSVAKDDPRPQFNTFINSYREDCGGLDCSIHPTRVGYEEIYTIPVFEKLQQSYRKLPDVILGVPDPDYLEDMRSIRTASNQKVTRENPPKDWPEREPTPGDDPADKNLERFVEVVAMRAVCEKAALGISETEITEDNFKSAILLAGQATLRAGEAERARIREYCSDPEVYEQYREEGEVAKRAYLSVMKEKK